MTWYLYCICLLLCYSCNSIRQSPKYSFTDGRYHSKILGNGSHQVYIHHKEEDLVVYPLSKRGHNYVIDTTAITPLVLNNTKIGSDYFRPMFHQSSFDIDFLTIPFKYRFAIKDIPRQLNANLNGAVYLGYRSDIYVVRYPTNLLGRTIRQNTHFGFSFGGFSGLGSTAINPWVSDNNISMEYDGVVWSKGVSGIIGLNNFTTGLAIGWDHLLDRNRKYWVYQNKPWIGLVFGLNLN